MERVEKVFCSDCKFGDFVFPYSPTCMHEGKPFSYVSRFPGDRKLCEDKNPRGECPYYKRIWWKFWRVKQMSHWTKKFGIETLVSDCAYE